MPDLIVTAGMTVEIARDVQIGEEPNGMLVIPAKQQAIVLHPAVLVNDRYRIAIPGFPLVLEVHPSDLQLPTWAGIHGGFNDGNVAAHHIGDAMRRKDGI